MRTIDAVLALVATVTATYTAGMLQLRKSRLDHQLQWQLERRKYEVDTRGAAVAQLAMKLEEAHQLCAKLTTTFSKTTSQIAWCAGQTPAEHDGAYQCAQADLQRLMALVRTWFGELIDDTTPLCGAANVCWGAHRHLLHATKKHGDSGPAAIDALMRRDASCARFDEHIHRLTVALAGARHGLDELRAA